MPRWKKILIKYLAGINVVLLASVVIAFVKPAWVGRLKGWFPHRPAAYKRSLITPHLTPEFNKTMTQRPQIAARPTPPPLAPKALIQEPARPQAGIPPKGAMPKTAAPSAPPAQGLDQGLDEYLEVGALYAQKGRYQKAEELFKKVTRENPSSAQAHNNLGFVYLKQGKYEAAEREFKESLRIDPAFVLPNYNLACLYSRRGQTAEALIYLNRALKKDARVKAWARSDEDFAKLRSDAVFQELIGAPAPKTTPQRQKADQGQEGVPKPAEPQKQEGSQENASPKQQGHQGGALNQKEPPGGTQHKETMQGGAQQGAQGGAVQ
jgi:tetratricopeptide (TPR) repeat protein